MIIGAHAIIYSADPGKDRAFLRDVLKFPHVDARGGYLIFALPRSEAAVHESKTNDRHELYLMCDDVNDFVAEMETHHIPCSPVQDQGWGLITHLTLPAGGKIGVYQPRHPRPPIA